MVERQRTVNPPQRNTVGSNPTLLTNGVCSSMGECLTVDQETLDRNQPYTLSVFA